MGLRERVDGWRVDGALSASMLMWVCEHVPWRSPGSAGAFRSASLPLSSPNRTLSTVGMRTHAPTQVRASHPMAWRATEHTWPIVVVPSPPLSACGRPFDQTLEFSVLCGVTLHVLTARTCAHVYCSVSTYLYLVVACRIVCTVPCPLRLSICLGMRPPNSSPPSPPPVITVFATLAEGMTAARARRHD